MTDELIDVVDEQDNVIGESMKSESHANGLWHRASTVFVFNDKNELLLQKRALTQRLPNKLGASASGHLIKGDSYEQGALRELKEELGITAKLTFVSMFKLNVAHSENDIDKEHCALYSCIYNGPFNIQKEELTCVKFYSIDAIKEMIVNQPDLFTLGFLKEFETYLKSI